MHIIRHKKIFLGLSLILVIFALVGFFVRGFNVGVEFTGGSIVEVSYIDRPDIAVIKETISHFDFNAQVQPFGDTNVVIRTRELTDTERNVLMESLVIGEQSPTQERFNSIGPSIGKELQTKAILALIVVALGIILFVAFAFRHVSKPVSSWKYGVIAVVALVHDVIIPAGLFAWLGLEIDSLFVVGLLSILGLSVNDTIVVFDRIRENLKTNQETNRHESFEQTVGTSINQTIARSINTSLTLVVVLAALYIMGPASTQNLALILLAGTIVGTYSSIFIASPLLVVLQKNKTVA